MCFVYRELRRSVSLDRVRFIVLRYFSRSAAIRQRTWPRLEGEEETIRNAVHTCKYTHAHVYILYITYTKNYTRPYKKCTTNSNGLAVIARPLHTRPDARGTLNLDVFIAMGFRSLLFSRPEKSFHPKKKTVARPTYFITSTRRGVTCSDGYTRPAADDLYFSPTAFSFDAFV